MNENNDEISALENEIVALEHDNDQLNREINRLQEDYDNLKAIIRNILNDLPIKHSWLNPETERMARYAVK